MTIRLAADLQPDSIVDGEGIRTVIWTQGCPHKCPGCHNAVTHDFKGGIEVDIEEVKEAICELKNQKGITFSGGDPMCQPKQCAELAKYVKQLGMDIWCYTGYTYEQLIDMNRKDINEFLKEIDVLIDGKFIIEEKSLNLLFRGSKNQRIIDVQKSLKNNEICLLYDSDENKKQKEKNYMFI